MRKILIGLILLMVVMGAICGIAISRSNATLERTAYLEELSE